MGFYVEQLNPMCILKRKTPDVVSANASQICSGLMTDTTHAGFRPTDGKKDEVGV